MSGYGTTEFDAPIIGEVKLGWLSIKDIREIEAIEAEAGGNAAAAGFEIAVEFVRRSVLTDAGGQLRFSKAEADALPWVAVAAIAEQVRIKNKLNAGGDDLGNSPTASPAIPSDG